MLKVLTVAGLGLFFVAYAFWPPREHLYPSLLFALLAFSSAYRFSRQ